MSLYMSLFKSKNNDVKITSSCITTWLNGLVIIYHFLNVVAAKVMKPRFEKNYIKLMLKVLSNDHWPIFKCHIWKSGKNDITQ